MSPRSLDELRRLAESELHGAAPTSDRREREDPTDELELHRIELTLQNEELRKREAELEATLERYRALFQSAPVGFLELGPKGVVRANEQIGRLLNVTPALCAGERLEKFIADESLGDYVRYRRELFTSAERCTAEFGIVARGGERRDVRLEKLGANEQTKTLLLALVDVTEQKRLAQRVQEAQGSSDLEVRQLAHDVRHLLMTIVASAENAALRATSPDAARTALEDLKQLALNAGGMITDVLERASGRRAEERGAELDSAVRRAAPLLRQLVGSGVRIELYPNAAGALVCLDAVELERILLNLAANARDAMPGGGTLRIETYTGTAAEARAAGDGWTALCVSDTGVGMESEVQARALEPFFSTKPDPRGSGLGLSAVHALVARSGGEVRISSEVGRGTTVRVYWPPTERRAAATNVAPSHAVGTEPALVLVVEDDPITRTAHRELLTEEGFRVVSARSAASALELCRRHSGELRLVLSDFSLPDADGTDLVQGLRRIRRDLPVILVSGRSQHDPELGAVLALDGVELVTKPVHAAALARTLRAALARPVEPESGPADTARGES